MINVFDRIIERRSSDSIKWQRYGSEVLPLWVADMDFASPEPVLQALQERIAHGVFGYGNPPAGLVEAICERLWQHYAWRVTPDQLLFLPGLVCGLNLVCRAIGQPGDGVLVQTPVYPPFLSAPRNQDRQLQIAPLAFSQRSGQGYYEPDYAAIEAAITARTRLLMLCHPHNPVGRIFSEQELVQFAELSHRHDLIICSDEIHCDLVLEGRHRPLATVDPNVAQRSITLMAPSKTFNLAGLGMSFAIIQNPSLLKQVQAAAEGIVAHVNVLGFHAALAAYTECDDWLQALLSYLRANRDYLATFVAQHLPGISMTSPEATYLAWLDCRQAVIEGDPHRFFIQKAKVAFNDGVTFGPGGEGFVRLNFGCPRAVLVQALERMHAAVSEHLG
ncbi:MAG: PatB family C-S lyase [Candidatus Competibacteraceae bacterium]|jgi:cystathionine beta-lyase|nr:PatB family C-S lyase [Candidatus Competibacteraceae bacterium]